MFGVLYISLFVALATSTGPPRHHEFFAPPVKAFSNRLSGKVLPKSYTLTFRLEEDFTETNIFTGSATIAITVGNLSTVDSSFQFHAKDLKFTSSVLKDKKGEIEATFSDSDPETDFVTVTPKTKLEPGDYTLVIEYSGLLSDTSMVGFYKSSYIDNFKKKKYVAATQFEEMHARRAFPCFDEPGIKATFSVSITYPKGYYAWSNAIAGSPKPDKENTNLETVRFGNTQKMSTYLVAFLVAEFNCKSGDPFNKKPIELCSEINAMDTSAKTALDAAPQLLQLMSTYTNFNYSMPKLTLVAIPDFAAGGMENWGLVTFRESNLLWYQNESSNYDKQIVLTVLAHELSHQWFGDYVTLNWWSDMFLNEGFATYFEYYVTEQVIPKNKPSWDLPNQFVVEQLHSALETDSLGTSLPLSYDTNDADFSDRTKDVSYNKGASILRMIHYFLNLSDFGNIMNNFKSGIIDYIANNALSTVTPERLWEAFQPYVNNLPEDKRPPEDIATIMENWIKQPGYPLVTVTSDGDDIVISQSEFSLSEKNDTQWYIPITYAFSAIEALDLSTRAWLTPNNVLKLNNASKDDGFIVVNNYQVGYYRVDYDEVLLSRIYHTLQDDIRNVNEISRAALIDDQINLAKSGKKSYSDALNFLTFLNGDDSYYSWYAAFNGFSYLLRYTVDEEVYNYLVAYIKKQMKTVIKKTSFNEENPDEHLNTLRQVLVLTWACKIRNENYVTGSVVKFEEYKSTNIRPSPNLRSIVYCNGLRNSKNATADFDFLWTQYQETKIFSEKITLLRALGCVPSITKKEEYLKMTITEESIRRQDATYVFSSVYSENPEGVTSTLNFIVNNHEDVTNHFGGVDTLNSLITKVADFITSQDQINILNKFSEIQDLDFSVKKSVIKATEIGAQNLKVIKRIEDELKIFATTTLESTTSTEETKSTEPTTTQRPNSDDAAIMRGSYLKPLAIALVVYVLFDL